MIPRGGGRFDRSLRSAAPARTGPVRQSPRRLRVHEEATVGRRHFLTASLAGAAGSLAIPGLAAAADLTDAEKANVKVVNDMCAAWAAPLDFDKIGRFLAEDCVYRASETAPP